jgi:hypothetical protein
MKSSILQALGCAPGGSLSGVFVRRSVHQNGPGWAHASDISDWELRLVYNSLSIMLLPARNADAQQYSGLSAGCYLLALDLYYRSSSLTARSPAANAALQQSANPCFEVSVLRARLPRIQIRRI